MVDATEERALEVERVQKKLKAQVILTEVGMEIRHLKKVFKLVEEKLAVVKEKTPEAEVREAKAKAEGTELAWKVMEIFWASEDLVDEKA
ncbi:hypothetical protein COCNU_scaffold019920G000010 [Cocos nucifera]|nr:hypothetical protein [Cocos nucifera]